MVRDWQAILYDQAHWAHVKRRVVTALLSGANAPPETLARLNRDVEAAARKFDGLFLEISDEIGLGRSID